MYPIKVVPNAYLKNMYMNIVAVIITSPGISAENWLDTPCGTPAGIFIVIFLFKNQE
ncbi:hypothetical protein D3C80_2185460 [compost metagenome]